MTWFRVYRPDPMDPKRKIASEAFETREKAEIEREQIIKDHPHVPRDEIYIAGVIHRSGL